MRAKLLSVFVLVFAIGLSVVAQDGPPPPPELGDGVVVVEGLTSPQGLFVDGEGTLWIVDSGIAGDDTIEYFNPSTYEITEARFGETARIVTLSADGEEAVAVGGLPSVNVGMDFIGGARIAELEDELYITYGAWLLGNGEEVAVPFFGDVARIGDGELISVASMWENELTDNPDGLENIETHPYGITAGPDGLLYAADAAGNSLVRIDPEAGTVETVVGFDGEPGVLPSPFREPGLCDPVPTAVVFNDNFDEDLAYVSFLSCAPFIPGSAKVVAVTMDGEYSDFAPGLTMVTDLQTGPDGNLYATQYGTFTQQGPVFNSGGVVRILEDGSAEMLIEGLPFVTALAFTEEGDAYVAINGVGIPEIGMVVLYEGLIDYEGTPIEMEMMEPAATEESEG